MLVQASDAIRLSGLTPHQLREWCGRRALVAADVPPAGRGHLALFSWQTILALRVLNDIHCNYAVEVASWREAIAQFKTLLHKRSFPSLWGHAAIFPNSQEASLDVMGQVLPSRSLLTVALDNHLEVLARPDELPVNMQLPLFPAVAVK